MARPVETIMWRIIFAVMLVGGGLPFGARAEQTNDVLAQATAAMRAAEPRAQADPARPIFHVTSPAQWMNDPNGPIFYRGWYHLFYQLTPYSDQSGVKYWGHVRSRDLAKWEALPIALGPSVERGEASVWSGCCTINGEGKPMAFYTSIGEGKSAFDQAEQWAAIGGEDLVKWQKLAANPVLGEAVNGGTKIYDWRDPFIFHAGAKTFLVAGGHLAKAGDAAVNIYEALNPGLTEWKYRGVLFHVPDAPTAECPNFFKLGNEWVLLVSPYGQVKYFAGSFDAGTCRFQARANGCLDYGSSFYAPNTMQVPDGRRLVWGWVNGFPGGHGWNGCLSLPRLLSWSRDGQLQQEPAPALVKLRGKGMEWRNVRLADDSQSWVLPATNTLEIGARITWQGAKRIELWIGSGDKDPAPVVVSLDGKELEVLGAKGPLGWGKGQRDVSLRIFIDRSVLEVSANESVWITKVIPTMGTKPELKIAAVGGAANVSRIWAWPMKSIW
jgi:beta-fructofuranosidase